MDIRVIQDWTDSHVALKPGAPLDVRYKVFRQGTRVFQDIQTADGAPLHRLELPQGMKLEKSSYEVLLRYVLTEVGAS